MIPNKAHVGRMLFFTNKISTTKNRLLMVPEFVEQRFYRSGTPMHVFLVRMSSLLRPASLANRRWQFGRIVGWLVTYPLMISGRAIQNRGVR